MRGKINARTHQRSNKLTPRQRKYIRYRATGANIPQAITAAGYDGHASHKTFEAMEATPHVQQALTHARTVEANRLAWDIEGWRREAEDALDHAKREQDLDARLRWLDIAAKHLGIYTQSQGDTSAAAAVIALLAGVRELPKVIEARPVTDQLVTPDS